MKYLAVLLLTPSLLLAQGPETPPGPPGPTQKSLQQIWNEVEAMRTVILSQEQEIETLRQRNRDLLRLAPELAELPGIDGFLEFYAVTVDDTGDTGANPSLAFLPSGSPVVAFEDHDDQTLRIAIGGQAGSWSLFTVVSGIGPASTPSLGIDGNGKPWIAFHDPASDELKVATTTSLSGGGGGLPVWTITTIDSDGSTGFFPDLVVRTPNRIGIAYRDASQTRLKYASFNGLLWTTEAVPKSGSNTGLSPSLAFTPSGDPAIACYDLSNQSMEYAVKSGGSWQLSGIERSSSAGAFNDLRFDLLGQPVVAYQDLGAGELRFARFNGAAWDKETVHTGPVEHVSLAIDSGNRAVVAFRNITTNQAAVAIRASSSWIPGRFPFVVRGANPRVEIAPNGLPVVAFHESQSDDLIFARALHYSFSPETP